jgi:4-hydroxy-tetrahydrodipicolinate synthase
MSGQFDGLAVALATPFDRFGEPDLEAFRRLVRHVVAGGVDTLVVLGTSGEAPTLDEAERDLLIQTCLEESRGRTVVAGTGTNSTAKSARYTRRAHDMGAAGALVVTPYYNKPMDAGLVAHYAAIAAASPGFPIIAYNVPGRTGVNISHAALARLWEISEVVALKESTGNLLRIAEIARTLPSGKTLLAGDDNVALPAIASGATGLVSVIANMLPRETKALVEASRRGDLAEAQRIDHRLRPLMDALFVESNPIPLKAGLSLLGICGPTVRLPLTTAEPSTHELLRAGLRVAAGALEGAPAS